MNIDKQAGQKCESEIIATYFATENHCTLGHLLKLFDIVEVIDLERKRMLNDPKNSHIYEQRIWKLHNEVTYHKNEYYRQKN